ARALRDHWGLGTEFVGTRESAFSWAAPLWNAWFDLNWYVNRKNLPDPGYLLTALEKAREFVREFATGLRRIAPKHRLNQNILFFGPDAARPLVEEVMREY